MDALGYIYEIVKTGPIPVGIDPTDEYFLWIILKGQTNAYNIHSLLKKEDRPISYKNVHRRIQKLFEGKLIEEVKVEGGYKHGARNFKLTTRGIVYLLSELKTPHDLPMISLMYAESPLFRTFLYSIFDRRTVKNATYSLNKLIENYLEECCVLTRYYLDFLSSYQFSDEDLPNVESGHIGDYAPLSILCYQLNWCIKAFVLKVVLMKEENTDWRGKYPLPPELRFPSEGKIRCIPNDTKETCTLLRGDQIFMRSLKQLESEFRDGYQMIMATSP